ncbi:hypothetical protein INT45_000702 [Circinella minor]|uniref:Uncharacterized protein n=1 Tax=Circinella minor TaxID=1195481 RepID=A0A8H7VHI2_9FUNG|nr:hypothetical protein INT45_000702 [Circinella minor]
MSTPNKPEKGKKIITIKRRFGEEDDDEEKVVGTKDAKKTRTFVPTKVKFEGEASSSKKENIDDEELEVFPPELQVKIMQQKTMK